MREPLAPNAVSDVGHQPQLGLLGGFGDRITSNYGGKTALRRQRQLIAREIFGRFVNSAGQAIWRFKRAGLGREEAKHHSLVSRNIAQRLKRARTRVVIFEEEDVVLARPPKHLPRNSLVAP